MHGHMNIKLSSLYFMQLVFKQSRYKRMCSMLKTKFHCDHNQFLAKKKTQFSFRSAAQLLSQFTRSSRNNVSTVPTSDKHTKPYVSLAVAQDLRLVRIICSVS
jgi:hypothetical protein